MSDDRKKKGGALRGKRLLLIGTSERERAELGEHARLWGMECLALPGIEDAILILERGFSFDVGLIRTGEPREPERARLGAFRAHRGVAEKPFILMMDRQPALPYPAGFALLACPWSSGDFYDLLTSFFDVGKVASSVELNSPAEEAPAPAPAPQRVLLAEDNPVNRMVALRILERMGFRVDCVEDGLEALAALQENIYDLLLLDIHMPRMGGLETMEVLRERVAPERRPRVFALSASAGEEERRRCLAAGMEAFLGKPPRERELRALLFHDSDARPPHPELSDTAGAVGNPQRQIALLRESLGAEATKDLVGIFLRTAAEQIEQIEQIDHAARGASSAGLHHAAHQLKGSCAQIGAADMVATCQKLENRGEERSMEGVTGLTAQLRQEFAVLQKWLHRHFT